ncbi:MAG: RagB/SusD family nutrient uptake outer membrane protein [Porphyromonadaceae bacterium]|nr:RagB/SusD family nutrient uptake outer membrane protein [Porphyromonadaceae bacterium]
MLMKKILYTSLFVVILLSTTGCNDLFKEIPYDKLSESSIWGDELQLDEYVLPWYRNMDNGFSTYVTTIMKGIGREYEPWYGDQLTVSRSAWYNADYGDILRSSQQEITTRGRTKWSTYYTQLRSINVLLQNADQITEGSHKQRVLGEAHFFRAYYYYLLLRMYGGPLLLTEPYDPLTNTTPLTRASYEETVDFIASEASLAASLLDAKIADSDAGRASKGAAYMLKAKTYFWASGVKFQNREEPYLGFPDDRTDLMYTLAAEAYDSLMALNQYSLIQISETTQDGIAEAYHEIFLTKNSQESIWEVQHNDDGNFDTGFGHKLDRETAPPSCYGTFAAYVPTQNHVDEYRTVSGQPIETATDYDASNPYKNRDYRFYANVLYDSCSFKGKILEIHYTYEKYGSSSYERGADLTPYGSSEQATYTRTGYYLKKFTRESQQIDTDEVYASSQNCIIWRYAEVLLDYAEIDFKQGRIDDAMEKLNQIRRRVHMPEYTSITWDDIVNERRVELAFEKSTYWDLIRWGIAEEKMSGSTNPLYGINIYKYNDGTPTVYRKKTVNGTDNTVRYFREMQYYWPVPWDEIRCHGIPQNPSWIEM